MATYFEACLGVSLIIATSAFGQQATQNSGISHSSGKKPIAAVKKTEKDLPDISWTNAYNKFHQYNSEELELRNISTKDRDVVMVVGSVWSSPQQEEAPTGTTNTFLSFKRSNVGHTDSAYTPKEVILLLDGSRHIYPTGSAKCKLVGCSLAMENFVGSWIVKDLASASTIEGLVDNVTFALKPSQIAAIKEFVESRHLISASSRMRWQGRTATEVSVELNRALVNEASQHSDEKFQQLRIKSLTAEAFTLSISSDVGTRFFDLWEISIALKDLKLTSDYPLDCTTGSPKCFKRNVTQGRSVGKQFDDGDVILMYMLLGRDNEDSLAYIYYRVMFCGDDLNFYPNN